MIYSPSTFSIGIIFSMKQSAISRFFKKPLEPESFTLTSFRPNANSPKPVSTKIKAPELPDSLPSPKRAALKYEKVLKRTFQHTWTTEFNWLLYKNGLMYCTVCCEFQHLHKVPNCVFITGIDRLRRDPLASHNKSPDHLRCLEAQAAQRAPKQTPLAVLQRRLDRKQLSTLCSIIHSAFVLAKVN